MQMLPFTLHNLSCYWTQIRVDGRRPLTGSVMPEALLSPRRHAPPRPPPPGALPPVNVWKQSARQERSGYAKMRPWHRGISEKTAAASVAESAAAASAAQGGGGATFAQAGAAHYPEYLRVQLDGAKVMTTPSHLTGADKSEWNSFYSLVSPRYTASRGAPTAEKVPQPPPVPMMSQQQALLLAARMEAATALVSGGGGPPDGESAWQRDWRMVRTFGDERYLGANQSLLS